MSELTVQRFDNQTVSAVLAIPRELPYPSSVLADMVRAVLEQDVPPAELIVVDARGKTAPTDFMPAGADAARVRHLPGDFTTRAAMFNAALHAASGEFLLAVYADAAAVTLRRSALHTMLMAATRGAPPNTGPHKQLAMVYGDYERVDAAGARREIHLLDWHEGRLRDTTDFGHAILYRTAALRDVGGWNEEFKAADLYDLRLRLSEKFALAHIANRYAGALYTVAAPAAAHNVFAYLLASKESQLEMERACTEHLRRIGAHLAPAAHVRRVEYSSADEAQFRDVAASIITPVNNRPQFIGRAIESVQAQTEQRIEMIVVVNGGEADPTCGEVRRYMPGGDKHRPDRPAVRLLVTDINNLGLCFNYGLQHARGKFYIQLDSDDRLKPDAVQKILAVFAADPTVGMVVGSYEVWTLDEKSGTLRRNEEIPVVTHDEWTADNGRNNLLRINGAGAPRAAHVKVIAEAGWFGVNDSPACRNYGEDYDLVLRISEQYTLGRVWEPIYEVIRHSGGTDHSIDPTTIERNDNAKDAMRLDAIARRRALNAGGRR